MKHSTLIQITSILLLLFNCSKLHSQEILWEKSYGGKQADYLMDAIPTADYGYLLAGSSVSIKSGNKTNDNIGNLDYYLWKMKENGDLEWQKSFGGTESDFLTSVQITQDGGYILAGVSSSNKGNDKKEDSFGFDDYWIIKLNAKGDEEWQKTIGGSGQEKLYTIKQTRQGDYIIAGSSSSKKTGVKSHEGYGNLDFWIVKLNHKGELIWDKTFGGVYADEVRSLVITPTNELFIGGNSNSPSSGTKTSEQFGMNDYWIVKLDNKGEEIWQKTIGGSGDDQLYTMIQTYDGNLVVAGNSGSPSDGLKNKSNKEGSDFWIVKIDTNGDLLWQETYNYGKADILTSVIENDDHSLFVSGFARGEMTALQKVKGKKSQKQAKAKKGTDDFIVLKINEKGEELWSEIIGSNGEDILKKSFETRDGGIILAGTSNGVKSRDKNTMIGSNDFWVVKLKDETKPDKIKLYIEAFPNPTNEFTNVIVGYDFEEGTATVVDLAGRVLQKFEITSRTVPIDLTAQPEGIYIVNIKTNVQSDGVKIIKGITKN